MKEGARRKKKHTEKPKKRRSQRREVEMSAADFEAIAKSVGLMFIVQQVTNLASRLASPPPPPPEPKAELKKKDFSVN